MVVGVKPLLSKARHKIKTKRTGLSEKPAETLTQASSLHAENGAGVLSRSRGRTTKTDPISTGKAKLLDQDSEAPLFKLPPELFQYIAKLLPPSSAAAFALCSHRLMNLIGTIYWKNCSQRLCLVYRMPRQWKVEKHALLALLSKDLDDYIHCFYCVKLHQPDSQPANPKDRRCTKANQYLIYCHGINYGHVQMAMKLHRAGKSPIANLNHLTATNGSSRHGRKENGDIPFIGYEPRIIDDEFYFRSQGCLAIPRKKATDGSSSIEYIKKQHLKLFIICGHLYLADDACIALISLMCYTLYSTETSHIRPRRAASGLHMCTHCKTEFQFHIKECGAKGYAFVATKWANLGEAHTVHDTKWATYKQAWYTGDIAPVEEGESIMTRFENVRPEDFDPVISKKQLSSMYGTDRGIYY